VSAQCTYSSGGAWVYPAPNTTGCSLGAAGDMFANLNGWKFHVDQIKLAGSAATSIRSSAATNLNDPLLDPQLHLQMLGALSAPIDLRTAQLQVGRLLHEVGGVGELVKADSGEDFVPIALLPQQATVTSAVFETPSGQAPHVVAVVQSKPGLALNFDVTVDRASLIDAENCVGTPQSFTRLHALVRLSGGGLPQPVDFAQVLDWQCVVNAPGTITALRSAANPAVGLAFGP